MSDFYLAGMLHDVGHLILATSDPDAYRGGELPSLDAEYDRHGVSHQEVGAYLLGLWGLPDPIVEAAAFHHAPRESSGRIMGPLTAVHVASAVVADESAEPVLDHSYLSAVGVGDRMDAWIGVCEDALARA
jgi:HD-like signal output (HDOD) protein